MSSTRKAESGSPLRQERYASDPAFNDHLKASAVARKCRLFTNPAHKELCLHLQYVSMQPGGLSAFVADFLKRYADRIGSKTMRENATRSILNSALVKEIRRELVTVSLFHETFPLKGETAALDPFGYRTADAERADADYLSSEHESAAALRERHRREADQFPESYPASAFFDYCLAQAEDQLEPWLADCCLNPETTFDNPPGWFYELERSLIDYIEDRRADGLAGMVVTTIGKQINDALEYAWEEKCLIHISGVARMGKTFQLQKWCASYPGRVRYVQVPSGNDDSSFYRSIARAIGTAAGSAMKASEMKRSIEDAVQDAGIMLVIDEAHYLFPQYKDVRSSPRRINWLLTEVVNKGIPVAIVSTPQFDTTQQAVVSGTGWADEQLNGRIAYRLDLPAKLPEEDLAAIAKHYFPEAPKEIAGILSWYARRSGKYLAGLEAVAKRARYIARKEGRFLPNGADLEKAMIQVDPAIAQIFNEKEETQAECKPPAKVPQPACKPAVRTVQSPGEKILATA